MKKPVVLAILDGLAFDTPSEGNAVSLANIKKLRSIWEDYSHTTLRADGEEVGLPDGQMGNSEVGHLNIGAGRIIYQALVLINKAIKEKTFFENEVYLDAIKNVKKNDSTLHIMGLLSDGGVHAHINHIKAMIEMAKKEEVKKVCVHAFLDGRDVDPKSAKKFIDQIQDTIKEQNCGQLVTVSGRYYAMDRDKRWDRVEKAYNTVIEGNHENDQEDFQKYIDKSYEEGVVDEFILPAQLPTYNGAEDKDSFIFMNFRPDRAMQLSAVLTNENYNPSPENPVFKPKFRPKDIVFVQTMKYSDDVIGEIAFKSEKISNTFGDVISQNGLSQLRIAETEKYPHVTFFFDGGVDKKIEGAKRILINSPKVATYDLKPEMSAKEVTQALLKELDNPDLDVVILNFANPDMVGHTGMVEPAVQALETVDECIEEIYNKVKEKGGSMFITADHGNCEKVLNEDGSPNTAHTINPVPFVLIDENKKLVDKIGRLSDIAPTILDLMGIDIPKEMTGESLLDG